MDVEKTIADIEYLEQMYDAPDNRGFSAADQQAANRRHDANVANNPWFRLWQQFGLPR